MPDRRVVITGYGVISSLGRGKEATLAAVHESRSGIGPILSFDSSPLTCRIAAEVAAADLGAEDPDYDRFARLALIAAREAATQAGLHDASLDRTRIGTIIGTGLGGSVTLDDAYQRMYAKEGRVPPMTIPRSMYNAATSAVSRELKALGPSFSVVSACSSGTHSLAQASQWVRSGFADMVIAGASDAPLITGIIRGWESLRVLAIDNDHPAEACRPFSADRKGLVLGEGAAVFVLESLDAATRRGAIPLGEILGVGLSSDAGHLTDPSIDGAVRAIESALRDGGLSLSDIEYINAHGTATRANDAAETAAIRQVFGALADAIPVSSTKAMHGHAMGASGAIEMAVTLAALSDGILPPTLNRRLADPECDLDYVVEGPRKSTARTFLSNSFGFGGMNGVIAARAGLV